MSKNRNRNRHVNKQQEFKSENSSRSRNRNYQQKPKEVEIDVDQTKLNMADIHKSDNNTLGWYTRIPGTLLAASNYIYEWPLGNSLDLFGVQPPTTPLPDVRVPGIMAIHYVPCIGQSTDPLSPCNLAFKRQHAFLQHTVSGTLPFEYSDLGMYNEAIISAIGVYADWVRVYGMLERWSPVNKYKVEALVNAMGYDYKSLRDNQAQFRALINDFAFNLTRFCIPGDLSMIDRTAWMNSGVYKDSDTEKAQLYLYVMDYYYIWREADEDHPETYLQALAFHDYYASGGAVPITFSTIKMMRDGILQPLMLSEDVGNISAKIMRAYGSNLYTVNPIAENFETIEEYRPEVLSQIENAVCIGPANQNSLTMEQMTGINEGGLYQQCKVIWPWTSAKFASNSAMLASILKKQIMVNLHLADPQAGDTVIATRLTPVISDVQTSTEGRVTITLGATGTEFATYMATYKYQTDVTTQKLALHMRRFVSYELLEEATMPDFAELACEWTQFDWAPTVYTMTSTNTAMYFSGMLQDTDMYTVFSPGDLKIMHDYALQSEYFSEFIDKNQSGYVSP